jgi:hypothetical protein
LRVSFATGVLLILWISLAELLWALSILILSAKLTHQAGGSPPTIQLKMWSHAGRGFLLILSFLFGRTLERGVWDKDQHRQFESLMAFVFCQIQRDSIYRFLFDMRPFDK